MVLNTINLTTEEFALYRAIKESLDFSFLFFTLLCCCGGSGVILKVPGNKNIFIVCFFVSKYLELL